MEKTKDNLPGAIDLLCKYVDLFMTDREAWEELAELYLQVQAGACLRASWTVFACQLRSRQAAHFCCLTSASSDHLQQQEQQVTCSSITATPHEMLTKQDGKRFWPLEKPSSLLHQPDAQGRARFPAVCYSFVQFCSFLLIMHGALFWLNVTESRFECTLLIVIPHSHACGRHTVIIQSYICALSATILQAQMYSQAAHCYEELLLHQAHNIHYYVQYADVLYTVGGANGHNYRTARSYYAAAVQLSGGRNVRALYGLCACTTQLAGIKVRQQGASMQALEHCCAVHLFCVQWHD